MSVTNTNLYFTRGDTYTFACRAQDYLQNIISLVSVAAIKCTVKRTPSDLVPLFQKTLSAGVTIVSAPAGTFTVIIAPADTNALPQYPQVLVYDVAVTEASGNVTTVQSGNIYLSADVTP